MSNPTFLVSWVVATLILLAVVFVAWKPLFELDRTYEQLAHDGIYLYGLVPTGSAAASTFSDDQDPSRLVVQVFPFSHQALCESPKEACEPMYRLQRENMTAYLEELLPVGCSYDVRLDIIAGSLIAAGIFTIAINIISGLFTCGKKNIVRPMSIGILCCLAFLGFGGVSLMGYLTMVKFQCWPGEDWQPKLKSLEQHGFYFGEGFVWAVGATILLFLNMVLTCVGANIKERKKRNAESGFSYEESDGLYAVRHGRY